MNIPFRSQYRNSSSSEAKRLLGIREAARRCGVSLAPGLVSKLMGIPAPGSGCHPGLLGGANVCRSYGLRPAQAAQVIIASIPHGDRDVTSQEVDDAVAKAYGENAARCVGQHSKMSILDRRPPIDGSKLFASYVTIGMVHGGTEEVMAAALTGRSPVSIPSAPQAQAAALLSACFKPAETVFCGGRHDAGRDALMPAGEWCALLASEPGCLASMPFIIANPLSGRFAQRADGRCRTLRGDACVVRFPHAVAEFDKRSRLEQLAFWHGMIDKGANVAAIIDSGNKSFHGWLRVDAAGAADWTELVERKLFGEFLVPLGVDSSCKNEARLSRMPGHTRENGRLQRLLYLAGGER